MRNAFAVPSSTDSSVTQMATMQLVQMLPKQLGIGEQTGASGRCSCPGTSRA